MAEGEVPDDEKRARAHKAFLVARTNYLYAAGWVAVCVKMPVHDREMGPGGTRDITMWAREHEAKREHLNKLYSTKLAMEEQEELDGYLET